MFFLRNTLIRLHLLFHHSPIWILSAILTGLSVSAWQWSYRGGLATSYGDAMAHLNLSRYVIDNIQPGVAQLGGVWLPLNHILQLTLIWNDWAWHSGMAGSLFSMIAFVISGIAIFQTVLELTKHRLSSVIATLAFALNLNLLYLQTTPLTEPAYLMLLCISFYLFLRWIHSHNNAFLFLLGLCGFLQVLTRYDGWFVVGIEGLAILAYSLFAQQKPLREGIGKTILFGFPVAFGVGLWILWNILIFGDPLYFALGPYSARSQQSAIEHRSGLLTKGSPWHSFEAYQYAMMENVGTALLVIAVLGILAFLFPKRTKETWITKLCILAFALSPIFFNILALYLGFSIINLPQLNWNPSGDEASQWFNVRYGIFALPAAVLFAGYLVSLKRFWAFGLLIVVLIEQAWIFNRGIITIIDGTKGSSAFNDWDSGEFLKTHVQPEDKVILSNSYFNAIAFSSRLPLKQIIHEGVNQQWDRALKMPQRYSEWLVMANGSIGDPLYTSLVEKQNQAFLQYYDLAYEGNHANIYRRKSTTLQKLEDLAPLTFITKSGTQLVKDNAPFYIEGLTVSGLVNYSAEQVAVLFLELKTLGFNTIRFEIRPANQDDTFLSEPETLTESDLTQFDTVLKTAALYRLYVIPILPASNQELISQIVTRVNPEQQKLYAEDPTILSWEVRPPVEMMPDPQAIRTHDPNHLIGLSPVISIGSQESSEVDAQLGCERPDVDLCSIRLLIQESSDHDFRTASELEAFLTHYRNQALGLNKPILITEIGISKSIQPFSRPPLVLFNRIIQSVEAMSYNGYVIWQWSQQPDELYSFSQDGYHGVYSLKDLKNVVSDPFLVSSE